jgi:hypothetical protein
VQFGIRHPQVIAAYAAVLGETGLRKQEGLRLKWNQTNLDQQILSVEYTKSWKARYIPLSDLRSPCSVHSRDWPNASTCLFDWNRSIDGANQRVHSMPDVLRRNSTGFDPRSASFPGNPMGSKRCRFENGSGTARTQFPHNDDQIRSFCSQPRVALYRRSPQARDAGARGRGPAKHGFRKPCVISAWEGNRTPTPLAGLRILRSETHKT